MPEPRPSLVQSVISLHDGWRRWLRARYGFLSEWHEDIIQQASADLIEWIDRRQQGRPIEPAELGRVGFRVLQRRAVDAYRDDARRWAIEPLLPEEDEPLGLDLGPHQGPQEAVEYAELLKAVVELLSGLQPSDRDLILRDELLGGSEAPVAMTPAERKRLSRLRKELRSQLFHRHQIDIKDM